MNERMRMKMHKYSIWYITSMPLGASLASEDRIAICSRVNHEVFGGRDRSRKKMAAVYGVLTLCHQHISLMRPGLFLPLFLQLRKLRLGERK